ncbi:exosomal polycystin-1-interacting protein [Gastrophryne carolinensis]
MKLRTLNLGRFIIRRSMSFSDQHLLVLGFLGLSTLTSLVLAQNHTLIFSRDNNIRNCSCSSEIQSCDYNLANLMCNCKTIILPKNWTGSRLSYNGDVTIWFPDMSTLDRLVNFSFVHSLKLSHCGATTLPTEYVAILGLRHLRVQGDASDEQSLIINSFSDQRSEERPDPASRDKQFPFHISYLETSVFNRFSLLKSYSVENISSILEHFPNLPFPSVISPAKSYVVTLIYGE